MALTGAPLPSRSVPAPKPHPDDCSPPHVLPRADDAAAIRAPAAFRAPSALRCLHPTCLPSRASRRALRLLQIKRRYRTLARQLHPDKNPSREAEEQFKLVTNAYTALQL